MLNPVNLSSDVLGALLDWSDISTGRLASAALLMFFSILLSLEAHSPYKKWTFKEWRQSCRTNASLFLFNSVVLSFFSAGLLLFSADLADGKGLLSFIESPLLKGLLAFLWFDLLFYLWHRACHHFEGLWLFHKVHHSDAHLNTSTAFRVHSIELLLTNLLKCGSVLLLGVDKSTVLLIEAVTTLFVMFHHANIAFPFERVMGRIFIVPFLHRLHHSKERAEHDRNFGAVFSLWDRVLGTAAEAEPLEIGLKDKSSPGFWAQLKFGFINTAKNAKSQLPVASTESIQTMVAEAAYYKALKRGFSTGDTFKDWVEAEREIRMRFMNLQGE
ncbi:MAG: sterol desaturase family protein [Methylicorpusculum sp.]|uniref:sterol desaturase family protein n=1 Tax=Methylicorpusculum sp. TaxID=2713644 RepID=UPI002726B980|nr:sterol desaturase family protein [Methylicorpusculum sp.]MDO8843949.1 sterol desaturase family protein [Methylicorpusculum sp.]MDO8939012.1 sterol desaturase family protein [Methylicorpusculum sp.]MDP2201834.1 sterol desaturase family protein [Methylicorpusculum sp.]